MEFVDGFVGYFNSVPFGEFVGLVITVAVIGLMLVIFINCKS